ncbi:MAG: NTP transferase domain-containing protein [Oscillospiraceae bacterium]|nr:NTP transferase domain-containing protein [Oscillospiraceae bacterium]
MVSPALVVMAAGMGSRFGGCKQLTPVGTHGEVLMEYAVYDALQAGFGRVVFIIQPGLEPAFRAQIGDRLAAYIPVTYVHQSLDKLPAGCAVPPGREKPWGTGHAILCCRGAVTEPFVAVTADDYYGKQAFSLLHTHLAGADTMAMVGYRLDSTLTENGTVSRGICTVENGRLRSITERTRIARQNGVPAYTEDGDTWHPLAPDSVASMSCWAFPARILDRLEELFVRFYATMPDPLKSEFYLPGAVSSLMAGGEAVDVLPTADRWFGMTYAADRPAVSAALANIGYPSPLWG